MSKTSNLADQSNSTSQGNKFRWTLKETVITIVLGAAFGFAYLGWVQVWLWLQAIIGPLAMDIVFGVWFMGNVVCARLIKKPGAALGNSMAAVVTQLLAGSPSGAILLLTGLVQGTGSEVAFGIGRWKRFGLGFAMLSGLTAAIASFAYTWIRFGYGNLEPSLVVTMFALRATSGMVLGGLGGWLVSRSLEASGVPQALGLGKTT